MKVLDFILRPIRSVIQATGQDVMRPLENTERETLGAVKALEEATESIEHHVEVIETLATSVGPLTQSVDRLVDTMQELVKILAPLAEAEQGFEHAERGVQRAEHFLGFHRHKPAVPPGPDSPPPQHE